MKAISTALLALGISLSAATDATARLNIFTCEPEWAALARELDPDAVIFSATHAGQDPHAVEARPALISALRRADLAICTGASLETGWLALLQQRSGNARVTPGAAGMFFASDGISLLEDAHHHSARDKGHVHAQGNPHFHLDPNLLPAVARRLAKKLGELAPERTSFYQQRLLSWESSWSAHIQRWQQAAKPLFGQAVIGEHSTFAYLFRWLEMVQIADLEPVPGVPPTAPHLQRLLQQARSDPPMAIIQARYQSPQAGRWLAEKLQIPLLTLPSTTADEIGAGRLHSLFDYLVTTLVEQLPPQAPRR